MIVNFYSYKGGVGRSQLVANLASYLCYYERKKILLIDWDLEAPGLHFFFNNGESPLKKGLLELLNDYLKFARSGSQIDDNELPFFSNDYISNLITTKENGKIDIIAGGIYDENYTHRVVEFDWFEFYSTYEGKYYIEFLKENLRKTDYDWIFIDSRTGISDYAGVCNVQMPDINFLVIAPTLQNIEGCYSIAQRVINSPYVKDGFRCPFIFPVFSRVDTSVKDWQSWIKQFENKYISIVSLLFIPLNIENSKSNAFVKNKTFLKYYQLIDNTYTLNNFEINKPDIEKLLKLFNLNEKVNRYFTNTFLDYDKSVAFGENLLFTDSIDNTIFDYKKLAENYRHIVNYLNDLSLNPELLKTTYSKVQELKLDLSNREIKDISFLKNFTNLISLKLSNNQISDISSLKELKNLTVLDLSNNKISDISSLKELTNLTILDLSNNQISDIFSLKELNNLTELNLSSNKLFEISALKELINLTNLSLKNNSIRELPEWLIEFTEMDILWTNELKNNAITLFENPILEPPIEIVKQGKNAIIEYFKQKKEQGFDYLLEAKLLILGDGGAGKTTLVRKLLDKSVLVPSESHSTVGIEISSYYFTESKYNKPVRVNIWDFGGQEIYKGIHEFFYARNSIYVVVIDSRKDPDYNYWFNSIEQLAGENANVIVVINTKSAHSIDFKENLKNKYAFVINIIEIDLANELQNFTNLKKRIESEIENKGAIYNQIPYHFKRIKDSLLSLNLNYISYNQFIEICKSYQVYDDNDFRLLSEYFNDIGIIVHYNNDDILKNIIFINPNFILKSIYNIVDSNALKLKQGRISTTDLLFTIGDKFEVEFFIRLLNKFGLIFKINQTDEYVIPMLLPTQKPYQEWKHQSEGHIIFFKYEFDKYMPSGLLPKLIVKLYGYIESNDLVWHRGVNIKYENSYAEIIELYSGVNTIEIKVAGTSKRELLAIIRFNINDIIKPFKKLNFNELVPCNCSVCSNNYNPNFYKYQDLIRRLDHKKENIECNISFETVDINKLLGDLDFKNSEHIHQYNGI